MTSLLNKHCKPCEGGVAPLTDDEVEPLLAELDTGWQRRDNGRAIGRRFEFPAYSRTIGFANAVAWVATVEGHHPVLVVAYGYCDVEFRTNAIGGLSENDFICAAKVDRLLD